MIEIIRWVLIALSLALIALLVMHTLRRARALSQRIDDYHAEEEAKKQKPGPINPYEDMGHLFGPKPEPEDEKRDNAE